MSYIKKIMQYFFHHDFSDEMVERVHRRLAQGKDRDMQHEVLQSLWDEMEFPMMEDGEVEQACARMEKKIGGVVKEQKQVQWRLPSFWMKMAASYLIPMLLLSASVYFYRQSENNLADKVALVEHFVPAGKREMVVLPDSSRVWLNSGSLLLYPSSFTGEHREVYLSGEGYFDVQKNPEKPFIVKVRALDVEVLGTRFDLQAYPESQLVTTTLEQGSVCVHLKNDDKSIYRLVPDDQLVYNVNSGKTDVCQVVSSDYSDWRDGGLFFDNYSFKEVIRILERTYGMSVHLKTSAYNENRLTVHFNKNESIENVMMLLKELVPGLDYQIVDKDIYLK